MKFKKGDKVVCIDGGRCTYLTYDKIYDVLFINSGLDVILIMDDSELQHWYVSSVFMSLEEYRSNIIEGILNE